MPKTKTGLRDALCAHLVEYTICCKLPIIDAVKEVGSGSNGYRRGMMRLLRDPKVSAIVVSLDEMIDDIV